MRRSMTKVAHFLERAWGQWVTRSLAVGALSTVLDLSVGGAVLALGYPTRAAAMAGTTLGSAFSYFASRGIAFTDRDPRRPTLLKFVFVTATASAIHGQFVVWFTGLGLPYVAAKMAADLIVYTAGQTLVLRYFVFPKKARTHGLVTEEAIHRAVTEPLPPTPGAAKGPGTTSML